MFKDLGHGSLQCTWQIRRLWTLRRQGRFTRTYVRSATWSWFGRNAVKFRHTRSADPTGTSSGVVVLDFRPRNAPFKSISFIRRLTVHLSHANVLSVKLLPYLSSFRRLRNSSHTLLISSFSMTSRLTRGEHLSGSTWQRFLAQIFDEAIWSVWQISSTP